MHVGKYLFICAEKSYRLLALYFVNSIVQL